MNRPVIRFESAPVEETAARDSAPAKRPMTAVSAELYRVYRRPVAISGRA